MWLAIRESGHWIRDVFSFSRIATTASEVMSRPLQALALENGVALRISRELADRKLAGQERVARHDLANEPVALSIREYRTELAEAFATDAVRLIESQAAKAYWSAWRNLSVTFPQKDLLRIPGHWLTFGTRISVLTGSQRLATNPVNAILIRMLAPIGDNVSFSLAITRFR